MTEDVVRQLLLNFGEVQRAQDPSLLREMVEAARSSSGLFDEEAWMNAISSDLGDWEVGGPTRVSSFFEDVFGTADPSEIKEQDLLGTSEQSARFPDEESGEDSKDKDMAQENEASSVQSGFQMKHAFRAEVFNIDMVLDAHALLLGAVLVWVFYILR